VPGSLMPSYRFLFDTRDKPASSDVEIQLPPGFAPPGKRVIASRDALDLVAYLKALDHTYPVVTDR
jgi:cytochrome c oxidase cbb3-type subunit 2